MACLFYYVSFTQHQCFPFQKGHTVNACVCRQTHNTLLHGLMHRPVPSVYFLKCNIFELCI